VKSETPRVRSAEGNIDLEFPIREARRTGHPLHGDFARGNRALIAAYIGNPIRKLTVMSSDFAVGELGVVSVVMIDLRGRMQACKVGGLD
jgi:hypothetical protein